MELLFLYELPVHTSYAVYAAYVLNVFGCENFFRMSSSNLVVISVSGSNLTVWFCRTRFTCLKYVMRASI